MKPWNYMLLSPLRIAVVYAVLGGLWILFSDQALSSIINDPALLTRFQTYKGWFFVSVTACLLYWMIRRSMADMRRSEASLFESEKRFRTLAENSRDMIYRMSLPDGRYEYVSPASKALLGYSAEEFYDSPVLIQKIIHPDWHRYFKEQWENLISDNMPPFYEYQIIHGSGEVKWLHQRNVLIKDNEGRPIAIEGVVTDITERKKVEERTSRLSRLYSILFRINETIVRVREPEKLYTQACRIIVDDGGFRMAWIGIIDPDTLLVKPVAVRGHEDGYLTEKRISIDEKIPEGRGPTGTAIRKAGYFICNDIENDPIMAPWRDEALKRGYRSSAAIALKSGTEVIGTLNIYSEAAYFFQKEEEEIKLLKALAEDISYAAEAMEIEKQRIKAEQELQMLTTELEDRVNNRTAELNDSQRTLMGLVEDLNEKTEELKSANVRLKEVDQLKSLFIASMSHELRTPLNSVIGFSSILLHQWKGPLNDDQKLMLSTVLRSGKHLLALINDVIDVTKIEAGKIDVEREDFDLFDLIAEAAELIGKEVDDKGLALQIGSIHLNMKTDRRRLLQCVLNLVSNAVKFTERGSVQVAVRRIEGEKVRRWENEIKNITSQPLNFSPSADFVEISVADTGIGIRQEDLPMLFQAFSRLDSPLRATVPGTGLGLYLTRKLAREVLRGEVSATSELGKGSRFTLKIPLGTEKP